MSNMVNPVPTKHDVTYGGVTLRVIHANEGEGIPKHEHAYSHLTMVHSGRLLVTKDGKRLEMTKDTQPVNLIAGEWHELEALEDGTVFVNVFAEGKY
jgi:quercetin dioxygenase-like cupin family protein